MTGVRRIFVKPAIVVFALLTAIALNGNQARAARIRGIPSNFDPHRVSQRPVNGNEYAFVSDRDEPGNWDIYTLNLTSGAVTRLTTDPAIDNHPDISHDRIVWTSIRGTATRPEGGDFDIYVADVADVEGTAQQLTFDDEDRGHPEKPEHYPDRHTHMSHDGKFIVFDSKNRPVKITETEVISECSVPRIVTSTVVRYYEGLNIIKLDPGGNVVTDLDISDAWDKANDTPPYIWVDYPPDPDEPTKKQDYTQTYIGHPSFSPDDTKIVFAASIDGEGTKWEVYTVGFDGDTSSLVSDSLRRITKGTLYPPNPNPIQMSGAGHFTTDGTRILFNSTQTSRGNSQIFWAYADKSDQPVRTSRRLTCHYANDYTAEPLSDGRFLVTSDGGIPGGWDVPPDVEGPTLDLDIFIMNADGSGRTNLTDNDAADEMYMIADEVSWFCGLPPNLTSCTRMPRIMNGEALWLMRDANRMIPVNLLQRFNIPDATVLYGTYWQNLEGWVETQPHLYGVWGEIQWRTQNLMDTFPGFVDPIVLSAWRQEWACCRERLFVLPSIMGNDGIGDRSLVDPEFGSVYRAVLDDGGFHLTWGPFGNGWYTVQWTDHLANSWQTPPGFWPRTATYWTGDANTGIGTRYYRVMAGSQ